MEEEDFSEADFTMVLVLEDRIASLDKEIKSLQLIRHDLWISAGYVKDRIRAMLDKKHDKQKKARKRG